MKKADEINDTELIIDDSLGHIVIPEEIDKLISSKYKCMILKSGRPFSMIADPDMKSILRHLGSRQELSARCETIASKVKSKIKYLLSSSSFISIAVDEWSDLCKRRYIGLSSRCLINGKISMYFLALTKIEAMHINGQYLNDILNGILDKYKIRDKVMNAVSDNCNLMTNAFSYSPILRLPCSCHLLSLFLKAFLIPSETIIQEISQATRCLKSSVCYNAMKMDFDEPMIKNYTEIRWVSLYQTFVSLQKSRLSIENFYLIETNSGHEVTHTLKSRHWDFIESYLPILEIYKHAIEILETDDFGAISLVLKSFQKIKRKIMKLPISIFYDNIQSFKKEFDEKMETFKDQIRPLYDAATILNPFVSNKNININAGIKYIEKQMEKLGWARENNDKETPKNSTVDFLSDSDDDQNTKESVPKGPVQTIIDLGKLQPDFDANDPNDSIGKALFRFWKARYDQNIDKILAQVALGILNFFCTSCSAERFFSRAGRVLTRDRMKLMADVAEAQLIIMSNKEIADSFLIFD